MEADDDDEMRALLGFSSFGRPRKRLRKVARSSGDADAKLQPEGDVVSHVVPGTSVGTAPLLPAASLRFRPHGVTLLVKTKTMDAKVLEHSLCGPQQACGSADEQRKAWAWRPSTSELLAALCVTKARFSELDPNAFALARRTANPYESLGRHRFINRSAMKMGNLDFLFQWTQRHIEAGDGGPFVFADICGGPGGFSEYLLWRMESSSRTTASPAAIGVGITLRGAEFCDWKVSASEPAKDENSPVQFYTCDGVDGSGDVYNTDNIRCFAETLRCHAPDGAQLVVADGGFPDARDQADQESVMTRLVVAEVLAMFSVLRRGGSFLCKAFELTSPLMFQLVWLLHQCFAELTIVKPVTSRPASSERYIVAQHLHDDLPFPAIVARLATLVATLGVEDSSKQSLFAGTDCSPSVEFIAFMTQASDRIARQQAAACERIIQHATASSSKRRKYDGVDRTQYYATWGV